MTLEKHEVVRQLGLARVVAMDSITHANQAYGPGDVLIGASFAGVVAVQFAAPFAPLAVIAHDCGIGRDGAGISGLWYLDGRGVAAAAVDSTTARIADGLDTWKRGIISTVNHWAEQAGVEPGQTVQQASELLIAAAGAPREDRQPRANRRVAARFGAVGVATMDSIRFALPVDRENIVCVGSHGGRTAASYALDIRPRGFISSDGGGGRDGSGYDGLHVLDEAGIPAAVVDVATARIGDGLSTFEDGIVSHHNATAAAQGVTVGSTARDAARLMAESI